jgi:hypothetical protein
VDASEVLGATGLEPMAWRGQLVLVAVVLVGLLLGPARPRTARLVAIAGLALAAGVAWTSRTAASIMPMGSHLVVDPLAQTVGAVLSIVALAVAITVPRTKGWTTIPLALMLLGLLVMTQAASTVALLIGLLLAALGAIGIRQAHDGPPADRLRPAVTGFAIAAFAATLWSGLGGDVDLAAAREAIAARPALPPVAVPLVLGLLLIGVAGTLLTLARGVAPIGSMAAWLVVGPVAAIMILTHRLLVPLPVAGTLAAVPTTLLLLGSLLTLGSLLAAATCQDLVQRLQLAVPAQLGIGWLALAVPTSGPAGLAAIDGIVLFVPTHVAAVLMARHAQRGTAVRLALTVLLLQLAAIPPLALWRARYGLIDGLLAQEAITACVAVALATLLGLVVYLRPLIPLWRPHTSDDETATAAEAATDIARPSGQATGLVIAWALWLFVLWLGWRGLA